MNKKQIKPYFVCFLTRILLPLYWALTGYVLSLGLMGILIFIFIFLGKNVSEIFDSKNNFLFAIFMPYLVSILMLVLGLLGKLPGTQVKLAQISTVKVKYWELIGFLFFGAILFFILFKVDKGLYFWWLILVWMILLIRRNKKFFRPQVS